MTKQECAIIQAYTGDKMLFGDDEVIFYDYITNLLKRHEINFKEALIPKICETIMERENHHILRALAEEDFKAICSMLVDINELLEDLVVEFEESDAGECEKCKKYADERDEEYEMIKDKLIDDFERIDEALASMESYLRNFIMEEKGVK